MQNSQVDKKAEIHEKKMHSMKSDFCWCFFCLLPLDGIVALLIYMIAIRLVIHAYNQATSVAVAATQTHNDFSSLYCACSLFSFSFALSLTHPLALINSICIMFLNHQRFACDFIQSDNMM